jgi:hypothetical protein
MLRPDTGQTLTVSPKGAVGFTPRTAIARRSAADNRTASHYPLSNRRMKMAASTAAVRPADFCLRSGQAYHDVTIF